MQALIDIVRNEIISYDRYVNEQLKVIGLPEAPESDSIVKDHFSYSGWVAAFDQYPVIKVEGLEDNPFLTSYFRNVTPTDIHLFVNQFDGYSFKWHEDFINVYLHVISGMKKVYKPNEVVLLTAGEGVYIPKREQHRVWSKANTWALSVGFEHERYDDISEDDRNMQLKL